jgi:3-oxoacyl-[acyl-carrier-protein] synthase II
MANEAAAASSRVVVTGLGAVSAFGWGVPALHAGLRGGRTAIGPFTRFDHTRQRTHVAGEVPGEPPTAFAKPPHWRRLAVADRFALFAAREAVGQAGQPRLDTTGVGVFFASSTAGMAEAEQFFAELLAGGAPNRRLLASHQLATPGEVVARDLGVRGPVQSISSACASGGLALEAALRALRAGEVDIALAGGADSLCRVTYSGFNSLRAVDAAPCRPFREGRGGMSIGEGAAVMVLEPLGRALERGAAPLAELLGAGASCDANHMTAPHPQGVGAAAALAGALADAGLAAGEIDFVNAHGTGTPLNDVAEWAALERAFGGRARTLPLTATKGMVGHLLGSSGAIEAVAAVLDLRDGSVHATPGEGPVDPAIAADLVLGAPRPLRQPRAAVSTSLAFGGSNVALVLGRWTG